MHDFELCVGIEILESLHEFCNEVLSTAVLCDGGDFVCLGAKQLAQTAEK